MHYFSGVKRLLGIHTDTYSLVLYEHEKGWRIEKIVNKKPDNQILSKEQGFDINDAITLFYEKKLQTEKELNINVPFTVPYI